MSCLLTPILLDFNNKPNRKKCTDVACNSKGCFYVIKDVYYRELLNYIGLKCPVCNSLLLTEEKHSLLQKEIFLKYVIRKNDVEKYFG